MLFRAAGRFCHWASPLQLFIGECASLSQEHTLLYPCANYLGTQTDALFFASLHLLYTWYSALYPRNIDHIVTFIKFLNNNLFIHFLLFDARWQSVVTHLTANFHPPVVRAAKIVVTNYTCGAYMAKLNNIRRRSLFSYAINISARSLIRTN